MVLWRKKRPATVGVLGGAARVDAETVVESYKQTNWRLYVENESLKLRVSELERGVHDLRERVVAAVGGDPRVAELQRRIAELEPEEPDLDDSFEDGDL